MCVHDHITSPIVVHVDNTHRLPLLVPQQKRRSAKPLPHSFADQEKTFVRECRVREFVILCR